MARSSTNRQPASQPDFVETTEAIEPEVPKGTKARTLAEMAEADISGRAGRKAQLLSSVRQHLAELADYDADAIEGDATRQQQADVCGVELYQARVDGLLTPDELSAMLGDIFGFKAKKDGSPSKTPEGYGNVLRQRVVRAVNMAEFLDGKSDGGAFYSGLPETALDDVESIRNKLDSGEIGIWRAYKLLGNVRSQTVTRPEFHIDASRVSAFADKLSDAEATADFWRQNKPLLTAYAKLHRVIGVVLSMPAK